jgi:hypothetical protein
MRQRVAMRRAHVLDGFSDLVSFLGCNPFVIEAEDGLDPFQSPSFVALRL